MLKLVKFDKRYLDLSWHWLQDQNLRKLIDADAITQTAQLKWYNSLSSRADYLIFGVETEKPIGVVGLKNIKGNEAEYFGYIGDPENRGKGFGKKILEEIFLIASEMKLETIHLRVLEFNNHAIRLYQNYGFVETNNKDNYIFMIKKTKNVHNS